MKKILIVDDSALMRRILCDIIEENKEYQVEDKAANGLEALELLRKKKYDAVILDVNMPVMTGIELLEKIQEEKIDARVMMASTDTRDGAQTTLEALEKGALDFIHKPDNVRECRVEHFKNKFFEILDVVSESKFSFVKTSVQKNVLEEKKEQELIKPEPRKTSTTRNSKIVAIASSTGGPKALQEVIPKLPAGLNAPVLLVQHMPPNFTKSLADRLNTLSDVTVKEAEEGEELQKGWVYVSKGGKHMTVTTNGGKTIIHYNDNPPREGVKPCANYMYESLKDVSADQVVCVVMTGMGADGTEGIKNLKKTKKLHVIAQESSTCAVYGMPKSVVNANLSDQIVPLDKIAQEIITNVGVR